MNYMTRVSDSFIDDASPSFANMFRAVTIGEKDIYKDSQEKIRYVGIAHLFAMSGLHIGIVIGIFSFLMKYLKINKKLRDILTLFFISIYIFSVQLSPSLIRAYLMCSIALVTHFLYDKYDVKRALVLSFLLSLIVKPIWLFNISFQMSYLAMIGIFYFYPLFRKINIIKSKILDYILFTVAIQIFLAPLIINTFGIMPLWSILSSTVLTPIGTVFILLSYFGIFLENFDLGFLLFPILEKVYNIFSYLIDYFYSYDFLNLAYYNKYVIYIYIPVFIAIILSIVYKKLEKMTNKKSHKSRKSFVALIFIGLWKNLSKRLCN